MKDIRMFLPPGTNTISVNIAKEVIKGESVKNLQRYKKVQIWINGAKARSFQNFQLPFQFGAEKSLGRKIPGRKRGHLGTKAIIK